MKKNMLEKEGCRYLSDNKRNGLSTVFKWRTVALVKKLMDKDRRLSIEFMATEVVISHGSFTTYDF